MAQWSLVCRCIHHVASRSEYGAYNDYVLNNNGQTFTIASNPLPSWYFAINDFFDLWVYWEWSMAWKDRLFLSSSVHWLDRRWCNNGPVGGPTCYPQGCASREAIYLCIILVTVFFYKYVCTVTHSTAIYLKDLRNISTWDYLYTVLVNTVSTNTSHIWQSQADTGLCYCNLY